MFDVGIGFHLAKLGDAHAVGCTDTRKVVTHQIDNHDIFGTIFGAELQFVADEQIRLGRNGTATGSLDGTRCGDIISNL